jgi:site-specific DNA-cytosine methylase
VKQHNYPKTIQLGDVTKINTSKLPKIDLLMGGSPCQNFSIACKTEHRKGLDGVKSKLFYEYVRILKETKPKYFLLENVGSMKKSDQEIITCILNTNPIKINSSVVSGQLRNRLYWTNIPNISQPEDKNISLNSVLEYGWSDRLKSRSLLESESRPLTTPIKMFHRYYSTGFTTLIFKNEQHYNECAKHYNQNFKGMSAKDIDRRIHIVNLDVYNGLRYLNQIELERLQTVPEGYTSPLTRNQAAGLLGDGWTVDVIAHIFKNLPYD